MFGLCSHIVGDLNWSIVIVRKMQSESGWSRLGLYNLNWSIERSFSGAIFVSESGLCFNLK